MATDNLVYLTGRISFPWIVEPQVKKNDKGVDVASYNCDVIMTPNDPAFAKFIALVQQMAVEKWKENAGVALQKINSDRKTRCYGQGEEKTSTKTFQVHAGYAGHVYIGARSDRQPQIIGSDGRQIDPTNTLQVRAVASKIYGGCFANVVVKPWLQQNDKGIGIRCDLVAIQFAKDGEPLGAGAADTTGMFGAVAAGPAVGTPAVAMPGFMGAAPGAPGMPGWTGAPTGAAAPSFMGNPAAPVFLGATPTIPSFLG